MPSTATITGKTGIAQAVTALAISPVRGFTFNLVGPNAGTLKVVNTSGVVTDFDIAATATVTATISSGVMALTVSQ